MTAAERMRRSRARAEAGVKLMTLEVDREAAVEKLLKLGYLRRSYAGAEPPWCEVETAAAKLWADLLVVSIDDDVTRNRRARKSGRW